MPFYLSNGKRKNKRPTVDTTDALKGILGMETIDEAVSNANALSKKLANDFVNKEYATKVEGKWGAKSDEGKLRMSLVPPSLIEAVARIRGYGVDKYGDPDNWKTVEAWRYKDALMRHLCEYLRDPNSVDAESGFLHIDHIACNVSFLIEFQKMEVQDK